MNVESVVEGLMSLAEDDCVALWMICCDVEEELGIEDPEATLQPTLDVVRELLRRGLIAGDSPAPGDGPYFNAWPIQDPEIIVEAIRRDWSKRGPPEWGDGPWFAQLRFCQPRHARA